MVRLQSTLSSCFCRKGKAESDFNQSEECPSKGPTLTTKHGLKLLDKLALTQSIWFMPSMDEYEAECALRNKPVGTFIVRQTTHHQLRGRIDAKSLSRPSSSQHGGLVLSLKTTNGWKYSVRHFLINCSCKGTFTVRGSKLRFSSIEALLHHYMMDREGLPAKLVLPIEVESSKTVDQLTSVSLKGKGFWTSGSQSAVASQKLKPPPPAISKSLSDSGSQNSSNFLKVTHFRSGVSHQTFHSQPRKNKCQSPRNGQQVFYQDHGRIGRRFVPILNGKREILKFVPMHEKYTNHCKDSIRFTESSSTQTFHPSLQVRSEIDTFSSLRSGSANTVPVMVRNSQDKDVRELPSRWKSPTILFPEKQNYGDTFLPESPCYDNVFGHYDESLLTSTTGSSCGTESSVTGESHGSTSSNQGFEEIFKLLDELALSCNFDDLSDQNDDIQCNSLSHNGSLETQAYNANLQSGFKDFSRPLSVDTGTNGDLASPWSCGYDPLENNDCDHSPHVDTGSLLLKVVPKTDGSQANSKSDHLPHHTKASCQPIQILSPSEANKVVYASSEIQFDYASPKQNAMSNSSEVYQFCHEAGVMNTSCVAGTKADQCFTQTVDSKLSKQKQNLGDFWDSGAAMDDEDIDWIRDETLINPPAMSGFSCKCVPYQSKSLKEKPVCVPPMLPMKPETLPGQAPSRSMGQVSSPSSIFRSDSLLRDDSREDNFPVSLPPLPKFPVGNLDDLCSASESSVPIQFRSHRFMANGRKYATSNTLSIYDNVSDGCSLYGDPNRHLASGDNDSERRSLHSNPNRHLVSGDRASMMSKLSSGTVYNEPWDWDNAHAQIINMLTQTGSKHDSIFHEASSFNESPDSMSDPFTSPTVSPIFLHPVAVEPKRLVSESAAEAMANEPGNESSWWQKVRDKLSRTKRADSLDPSAAPIRPGLTADLTESEEHGKCPKSVSGAQYSGDGAKPKTPVSRLSLMNRNLLVDRVNAGLHPMHTFNHLYVRCHKELFSDKEDSIAQYVVDIGRSVGSTFKRSIDSFCFCIVQSTEKEPQAVLSEVRQFMTGMKHYLTVAEGEPTINEFIRIQQNQLKQPEVFNIDEALESAMTTLVLEPLHSILTQRLTYKYSCAGLMSVMTKGITAARSFDITELGMVDVSMVPPSSETVESVHKKLKHLQKTSSPKGKMKIWLKVLCIIVNGMTPKLKGEDPIPINDLQLMLVYCLIHCGFANMEIDIDYMLALLHPDVLSGHDGYYLSVLAGAVTIIKDICKRYCDSSPTQRTMGSVSSNVSLGMVKVHIPNEGTNTVDVKFVPLRPKITAAELGNTVALSLGLSNAHLYEFCKVIAGRETPIYNMSLMDEIATDQSIEGAILAFKKRSLTFAWPKDLSDC